MSSIDCRYLHGSLCVLGRYRGCPTSEDCSSCRSRKAAAGAGCPLPVAANESTAGSSGAAAAARPKPRGADVMLGGAWFDRPQLGQCESKRRFVRDWFAGHDDDAGVVARHAAD